MELSFVLNAFRHQRFDTKSCTLSAIASYVLNAFRHQRFDTLEIERAKLIGFLCSTPFGIRDSTLFVLIVNLLTV